MDSFQLGAGHEDQRAHSCGRQSVGGGFGIPSQGDDFHRGSVRGGQVEKAVWHIGKWQCVKTNSTPSVHIKIAGIYGCSSH